MHYVLFDGPRVARPVISIIIPLGHGDPPVSPQNSSAAKDGDNTPACDVFGRMQGIDLPNMDRPV